jgi:hypothetical protein
MKLMTTFFATTLVLLALAPQTFGQGANNRVQPRPVTQAVPKVIKFEGKGLQPALPSASNIARR